MTENVYVLATPKPWNLAAYSAARARLPGEWLVVTSPDDLTALLSFVAPRYIFFPHWSHIVPEDITERYECVCFHMTDVPYGRGGSPLQNLIERGCRETRLSALRMTTILDGGPVYLKRPLALHGTAHDIFVRAADQIFDMIEWIVAHEPVPSPQGGDPTVFPRRSPAQSRLPSATGSHQLYDHIRMLDAPGYPTAFLEEGGWRLEFDRACLEGDILEARVRFFKSTGETG